MFTDGTIQDVLVRPLVKFTDSRGWLTELFREDELEKEFFPAMGYISMTAPGVVRGPHEHVDQADHFAFPGPSNFMICLWDNRKTSPTFMIRQVVQAGEDAPRALIVPKGVVHAYKNIGTTHGMVLNFPNRLFAGKGKTSRVDEIRHESDPGSIFRVE
jgi:dTDP-4-dehydrorhamnose 3,5-epimerase